jgi:FKBP-type peptidyl-prolyl cis-trans isomerase 2
MRRHDRTRASLTVSLACMTLLGINGVGGEPIQASSSRSSEAKSAHIGDGSKVTLQYVVSVSGLSGIEYDEVREFIQGRHEIFQVMEQNVVGMKPGEQKTLELSPSESLGPHDDRKKLSIPKTLLPFGAKTGDVLKNDLGDLATVAEVSDATAVLDYNHPLAGKPLVVQLKILKVENP